MGSRSFKGLLVAKISQSSETTAKPCNSANFQTLVVATLRSQGRSVLEFRIWALQSRPPSLLPADYLGSGERERQADCVDAAWR